MSDTKKGALQEFIAINSDPETGVFDDNAAAYHDLRFSNAIVKNSINPYVNGKERVRGTEPLV